MPNENVEAGWKHSELGLARTVKNSRTLLQSAMRRRKQTSGQHLTEARPGPFLS